MAIKDEDKTAFRTDIGIFCYTKMPFGLKNAGATYQRLTDKAFSRQIGRNLEVYVDDLVIKSNEEEVMLKDIEETLERLRSINMKLNLAKCSFGMEEGKLLGVMVTKEGLRPNPDKVLAIARMPSPTSVKEVQTLNGCLVAINRFLANHAAKALPFIETLKNCLKKSQFRWTEEAESAFQEMKDYTLPTLTAPIPGEALILYLSASERAVGDVLLVERKGVQTTVYYVNRVLTSPETRYSTLEKLVLALVHASRRLNRYFQAHPVTVLTNHKLQNVLRKPELSGRLAQWAIELGAHQLTYKPRPAIKGQVLADFVSEIPKEKATECAREEEEQQAQGAKETWSLFTDGASNEEGCGAGLRLLSPEGNEFTYL
ncbi:hypothetical protein L1987_41330 [Smallanthus sonchifolius]|uniref:Uncharacterized protein n=1 Tax=Smallanthus sonchifolius TaxID=185202 RepID=A0ACB9GVN0_9ASTR|nr:hypothetical protein L1987_41330 [Smallanthus sonchifolius]